MARAYKAPLVRPEEERNCRSRAAVQSLPTARKHRAKDLAHMPRRPVRQLSARDLVCRHRPGRRAEGCRRPVAMNRRSTKRLHQSPLLLLPAWETARVAPMRSSRT